MYTFSRTSQKRVPDVHVHVALIQATAIVDYSIGRILHRIYSQAQDAAARICRLTPHPFATAFFCSHSQSLSTLPISITFNNRRTEKEHEALPYVCSCPS